jgi:two-component system, NarL family, nitrate/nitrite response regulator NarL
MAGSVPHATATRPQRSGPQAGVPARSGANGAEVAAREELLAGAGQRLRVLIADHDGLARWMMRTALHEAERVATVHLAADAREALQLARYYSPTVALIDTALPPDGAVDLIAKILALAPQTRILTVSVDDHQTAIAALRAGAVGHIAKDIDPDELARQVARAADGEAIIPQRLLMPLLEVLREVPDAGWRPLHSRLTTREWEIVELLADGASTHRIAQQLVLSPSTVYSHVKSVLRKLGVHSRQDAVAAAEHLRRHEASATKHPHPVRESSPV